MARKDETGELVTVSELLERSQTKPLLIREELDELLEAHPVRTQEAPPPEPERRRVRPLWLAVGAAAVLGVALVLLLPSDDVGGTAGTPPRVPYTPPPTSSEAVATISATVAPTTATAGIRNEPVKTTSDRKPAAPPSETTLAEDDWRDLISSVISSYQNGPGGHGRPQR
jgi:hypothetical protein